MLHIKRGERAPPQGRKEICWIEILDEYAEGLKESKHGQ
jgi:hypothetical protein